MCVCAHVCEHVYMHMHAEGKPVEGEIQEVENVFKSKLIEIRDYNTIIQNAIKQTFIE